MANWPPEKEVHVRHLERKGMQCSHCGFLTDETTEFCNNCGSPLISSAQYHDNLSSAFVACPSDQTIKRQNSRVLLWGTTRFLLGILFAGLMWVFLIGNGIVFLFPIALSIAIALSGILSILTNRSLAELSESWSALSGISKFILAVGICILFYIGILIIGINVSK